MAIKLGKYNVCVLDLLTDSRTGRLSASKVWLHIANGIMSYIMLKSDSVDWELLTAYGGIVGGSYVAILFFKLRYSGATVSGGYSGEHIPDESMDGVEERGETERPARTAKRPVQGGSGRNGKGKR